MKDTLLALWELLRFAARCRFRLSPRYLRYRMELAYGPGWEETPRKGLLRDILRYGHWLRRMRTGASRAGGKASRGNPDAGPG